MNKDLEKIIKEIECYQNEDMCLIMLSQKENKALLDYITNLQQENDNMEKIIKRNKYKKRILELEEACSFLQQENERLKEQSKKDNHILGCNFASKDKYKQRYEDYKSRCEKAIEMLKEIHKILPGTYNQLLIEITQTLNILQNGSDSQ